MISFMITHSSAEIQILAVNQEAATTDQEGLSGGQLPFLIDTSIRPPPPRFPGQAAGSYLISSKSFLGFQSFSGPLYLNS